VADVAGLLTRLIRRYAFLARLYPSDLKQADEVDLRTS
jgi:hypothetical protein